MARRSILLVLSALLLNGVAYPTEWWDKKPYMEWSMVEVERVS